MFIAAHLSLVDRLFALPGTSALSPTCKCVKQIIRCASLTLSEDIFKALYLVLVQVRVHCQFRSFRNNIYVCRALLNNNAEFYGRSSLLVTVELDKVVPAQFEYLHHNICKCRQKAMPKACKIRRKTNVSVAIT
jgi:hypothetical protein